MIFLPRARLEAMNRKAAMDVRPRHGASRTRPHRSVPRLEALEDRMMLSRGISFAAPIDFPTGATPSAAAFNAISGDQIGLATELQNAVAVGDLNGDGNPDVAVTNPVAGSVSVFRGDGRGSFAPPQTYQVGTKPNGIVVGDFNGDGILDLATVDSGSNDVGVLFGKGDGTFAPAQFLKVGNTPVALTVGEFDGDAIPDLAVANKADGSVSILTGNGDGAFAVAKTIQTPRDSLGKAIPVDTVAAGAFHADEGRQDLVVGSGASPTGDHVLVYVNHDGNFGMGQATGGSTIPDQSVTVGGTPRSIAVADLNGDGRLDLAVANEATADVTILLGDGPGAFTSTQTVHLGQLPRSVAVGDLNRDGIPDLVTANFGSSTVSVLRGSGDGAFEPAQDFWAGEEPSGVAVGGFDGQGRTDVVVGRIRTDRLSLLRSFPEPPDRVQILRDINYSNIPNDPNPDHHTLDVYLPPPGTTPFAGDGRPLPVVLFVHGGGGTGQDKSGSRLLMRTLAREGIIAVSINYRLSEAQGNDQITDVAAAFAWVYRHVATFGGDPGNLFVFGHSTGSKLLGQLSTDPRWLNQQGLSPSDIRGAILAAPAGIDSSDVHAGQPPCLLLDGDEGRERQVVAAAAAFDAACIAAGAQVQWDIIGGRDHLTLLADTALPDDAGRQAILSFIAAELTPTAPLDSPAAGLTAIPGLIEGSPVAGKGVDRTALVVPLGDQPPPRFCPGDPCLTLSPVFALNFGESSPEAPHALNGPVQAAGQTPPTPVSPVFFDPANRERTTPAGPSRDAVDQIFAGLGDGTDDALLMF
jgi:carboxylesterase family protein/VCBS repeat protein